MAGTVSAHDATGAEPLQYKPVRLLEQGPGQPSTIRQGQQQDDYRRRHLVELCTWANFQWDGLQVCIPVDRYLKLEDNLTAIHHVIEARRTELRHGTLALVRASFTGFSALPPPNSPWRDILGIKGPATKETVQAAYRKLAVGRHPDSGGSDAMMAELNAARDAALREVA